MNNKKTKVYIYTRVSTVMQIDGYSLEAQKNKMKNYAEFNDFKIAGEYEDAGKSGKSIEPFVYYMWWHFLPPLRICWKCWI